MGHSNVLTTFVHSFINCLYAPVLTTCSNVLTTSSNVLTTCSNVLTTSSNVLTTCSNVLTTCIMYICSCMSRSLARKNLDSFVICNHEL